ncbi:MAG: hypothetical protein LBQ90_07960 [Synergistaceae bacterium]|jgi:hypothetical protein|nr:hypothetical protein [Synergistaceae bacterium]
MDYDGTKLVYSEGMPQWLMPDGSLVPVKYGSDGSIRSGGLYLRDRATNATLLICD